MTVDAAAVAQEVQDHLERWNPGSSDLGTSRLIGEQAHTPGGDASDLPEVPTDEDGNPQYDEMKNEDLEKHLGARGLSKSGNKADMVARLEEYDAEQEGDEEGDDED